MLNIYIGEENLPKDMLLVTDADAAFGAVDMCGTEFQRRVLHTVELGEYYDTKRFIDRFGCQLHYTNMSTGSKTLMLVEALPDRIISCDECGENALGMLTYLSSGNIFLPRRSIALPWEVDCAVTCNGRVWERISLLNDLIG